MSLIYAVLNVVKTPFHFDITTTPSLWINLWDVSIESC